jgi:hypothetical protein
MFKPTHEQLRAWLETYGPIAGGLNTINYENPNAGGAVAPTAAQMRTHQQMSAIITGDGATLTTVIVHNMNISAADLALGYPEVYTENLLAAGNTAATQVTTKTANNITLTNVAFTGAGVRVRIKRPWSPLR